MARRDKYDIELFHISKIYIPTRTIYIGSESSEGGAESGTDFAMAERAIKNLAILESISKEPITILTDNTGGDVAHGLAIYDAIKTCESEIIMKVYGNACSMGSIILQAADARVMAPNAVVMIHYGSLSLDGHALTAYKITEEYKRIDKWMEKMYLAKIQEKQPHFKLPRLQRLLNHDTYLTAQQAVDMGLADKILG